MPTRVIETPPRWNSPSIRIGNIEGKTLYVNFTFEPTPQLPRRISGFKIWYVGVALVTDSEEVVFEGPEASRIASEIATALIYIAEIQRPRLTNMPVQGHPEIIVEQLDSGEVRIANQDRDILIPCALVSSLGEKLRSRW